MDKVRAWRNLEHVKATMFTDNNITEDEHKSWFELTLLSDDADYQIVEYQHRQIGLANAIKINAVAKSCFWGFYIAELDCPKGCGTFMALLMLEHIFSIHSVHTIYAEVFEFNNASLKLHDKFGFKAMIELNRTVLKNGAKENVVTLSLSRDDWDNLKQNIISTLKP